MPLLLAFCLLLAFSGCSAGNETGAMAGQASLPREEAASPEEAPNGEFRPISFSPDAVMGVRRATLIYTLLGENRSIVHTAELTNQKPLAAPEASLREAEKLGMAANCFSKDTANILALYFANGTQASVCAALDSCPVVRAGGADYHFTPPPHRDRGGEPGNEMRYPLFSASLS